MEANKVNPEELEYGVLFFTAVVAKDMIASHGRPQYEPHKIACKVSFECLHVEYYPTVLPNLSRETSFSSYPCFVKSVLQIWGLAA